MADSRIAGPGLDGRAQATDHVPHSMPDRDYHESVSFPTSHQFDTGRNNPLELTTSYQDHDVSRHNRTEGRSTAKQAIRKVFSTNEKIEQVYIAVMGVTGAGKSSFIELCTGQGIGVGQGLRSYTQEVGEYCFMFSPTIRIHLIDTPGFDDTDRKDSEVLRDVAGWLGVSYKTGIRLSGIIYLHRIIDPRMQGTAKRNLFMFQKLCGPECFGQIVLATTMWSLVPPDMGALREKELIDTEDFWGYMYRKGSNVLRHTDQNNRSSALAILDTVIRRRHKVTLQIQREMDQGLDLEETQAGQQLNADIIREREKHRAEMYELQQGMRDALKAKDEAAAASIRKLQEETAANIKAGEESQKRLRIDLEKLQAEREADLKKLQAEVKENAERYKAQQELCVQLQQSSKSHEKERESWQQELEKLRDLQDQLTQNLQHVAQKKSGVASNIGEFLTGFCEGFVSTLPKVLTVVGNTLSIISMVASFSNPSRGFDYGEFDEHEAYDAVLDLGAIMDE